VRPHPRRVRVALLAGFVVLLVAGAAYAVASGLSKNNNPPRAAVSGTGPAWLGVELTSAGIRGAMVSAVVPGSPAASAGIHPGDAITAALGLRHSILAAEIADPREAEIPAVGHLALVDPESGARVEVDSTNRRLRGRFAPVERERRETLARELRRLRVDHVALATDQDWLLAWGAHLR
jgi:uncharacterized protein (DUF58 family)